MLRHHSLIDKLIKTFGTETTVSVIVASGAKYSGRIVGGIRHCDNPVPIVTDVENEIEPEFLLLYLTTATDPFVVKQTIAINILLIEAIG